MGMAQTIAQVGGAAIGRRYTRAVAPPVRVRILASVTLAVGLIGGCVGLVPPPALPAVAPGTRACVGLPQATCQQVFQDADARARERGTTIVGVVIRCTSVCTEASGEAEQTVTFGDGTREQGGFGWQSAGPAPAGKPIGPDPSLPILPTCVGVDDVTCASRAIEAVDSLGLDPAIVIGIVVRCTPGPCTPTNGDGETTISLADGQQRSIGWSYQGGP
jgi:hypothetical protein